MSSDQPSARSFLQSVAPDVFSDTTEDDLLPDVATLDHFLATITERMQEHAFAAFCKRLVEREVCPNVLPQSGPVGGGDSKMDSVTYPVDRDAPTAFYLRHPVAPTSERWAFAFSAKKKWKQKIEDDVAKIAELSEKAHRIYCVTNQVISDKKRADLEAHLKTRHGIDCHLLDRTWIVAKVREHRHLDLLAEELGFSVPRGPTKVGPQDQRRLAEIDRIEVLLRNGSLNDVERAEHLLRTAVLSAELGRDVTHVTALLGESERIAVAAENRAQHLRTLYWRAWLVYFYFDDVRDFRSTCDRYWQELRVMDVWELGNAVSLGLIGRGGVARLAQLDENWANDKLRDLRTTLLAVESEQNLPNAAVHARMLRCTLDIAEASDERRHDEIIGELSECLERSRGLLQFPIRYLVQLAEDVDGLRPTAASGELVASCAAELGRREGARPEALVRLRQARRAISSGEADFVKLVGVLPRIRLAFDLEGSFDEFIQASMLLANAYMELDCWWAARRELLRTHAMLCDHSRLGARVTTRAAGCMLGICRCDVELGAVVDFMSWRRRAQALLEQWNSPALLEEYRLIDYLLASRLAASRSQVVFARLCDYSPAFVFLDLPISSLVLALTVEDLDGWVRLSKVSGAPTIHGEARAAMENNLFARASPLLEDHETPSTAVYGQTIRITGETSSNQTMTAVAECVLAILEATFCASRTDRKLDGIGLRIEVDPHEQRLMPQFELEERMVTLRVADAAVDATSVSTEELLGWYSQLLDLIVDLSGAPELVEELERQIEQASLLERTVRILPLFSTYLPVDVFAERRREQWIIPGVAPLAFRGFRPLKMKSQTKRTAPL